MITNLRVEDVHAVVRSIQCAATLDELKAVLSIEFRAVLAHDMAAFGIIDTDTLRVRNLVNIDFPDAYLTQVIDKTQILTSPVVKSWRCNQTPQFFDLNEIRAQANRQFVEAICDFDIRNIASHGVVDLASNVGSYFAFGRLHSPDPEHVRKLLELVVPHFHIALTRMINRDATYARDLPTNVTTLPETAGPTPYRQWLAPLSVREREVLTWLYYGKSNSEIATILNVSTFTIKNHVQNILLKLSANNRSHAVWRAIEIGLVDISDRRGDLVDAAEQRAAYTHDQR